MAERNEGFDCWGTDAFMGKLFRAYKYEVTEEMDRHSRSLDEAIELACATLHARVCAGSNDEMYLSPGGGDYEIPESEIRAFAAGLLLGNFIGRQGVALHQKPESKDLS